jgi:hypothetical protein
MLRSYGNVDRVYLLPRPAPSGALLLVHLENAIRRGQTKYEWLCLFFDDAAEPETIELAAEQEVRRRCRSSHAVGRSVHGG